MRRLWRDFWTAFWLAYTQAQQRRSRLPEPPPDVAPAPAFVWPDTYTVCTVAVECELCGETFVQVTEGWLLDHAGQHLLCPICTLPTPQVIRYEAQA